MDGNLSKCYIACYYNNFDVVRYLFVHSQEGCESTLFSHLSLAMMMIVLGYVCYLFAYIQHILTDRPATVNR
jgi:hypothetical protein